MKLAVWIVIAALLGAALPAAAGDWADDRSMSGPEYAQSKAICNSLKGLSLPATDGSDEAAAAALKGCSSEALYFGIGTSPDPVRARQCAYLRTRVSSRQRRVFRKHDADDHLRQRRRSRAEPRSRHHDGLSARRRAGGGRWPSQSPRCLKARHWVGHDFGFCDDITSGYAQGLCAAHDAALSDAKRKQEFAGITVGWSEEDRRAFADLARRAGPTRCGLCTPANGRLAGPGAASEKGDLKMTADDRFDLERFVTAQAPVFETVLAELRAGRKRSHWMWFVFPQLAGLGRSSTARFYGIGSIDEARGYLAHPLLGPRLDLCTRIVLASDNSSLHAIFGSPDDMKFRSCMTLFSRATNDLDNPFGHALDRWCSGRPDEQTLALIDAGG